MYKRIGKKLRVLAVAWCVLGALGAIAAGVLMYLGKTELWICIATAFGGAVFCVLSSWGLYALGDIHVKLERLENKLIPKPSYMSYLGDNQPLRGQCELCGKTTDLVNAKIVDKMGTRFRKVCRECFAKNQCEDAE